MSIYYAITCLKEEVEKIQSIINDYYCKSITEKAAVRRLSMRAKLLKYLADSFLDEEEEGKSEKE